MSCPAGPCLLISSVIHRFSAAMHSDLVPTALWVLSVRTPSSWPDRRILAISSPLGVRGVLTSGEFVCPAPPPIGPAHRLSGWPVASGAAASCPAR
jgi:hypothetical protein